jgi:hypothetical protein
VAHPALALQREGPLDARLQAHPASPSGARRRLPDPRLARDGARHAANPVPGCRAIGDSTHIIAALEERYPEPPLYPGDAAALHRALALEDYFDEQLGPALRAAIVTPLFRHDPDLALRVLTTGMPDKAYQTLRPLVRFFPAFYRFRHKISDSKLKADRASVIGYLGSPIARCYRGPSRWRTYGHFGPQLLAAQSVRFRRQLAG